MTFNDLEKSAHAFRPASWYDEFLSRGARIAVLRVLLALAVAALIIAFELVTEGTRGFFSAFCIVAALVCSLSGFEFYYNSLQYRKLKNGLGFELAGIIRAGARGDVTEAFAGSAFGKEALARTGISAEAAGAFFGKKVSKLEAAAFAVEGEKISLSKFAEAVYGNDEEFREFLFASGVVEDDWSGTVRWLERELEVRKSKERWWSRDNLSKVRGIGKAWGYGQVWLLEKYGYEFARTHDLGGIDIFGSYHRSETDELETVLARSSEANALLIGEEVGGPTDVVARLAKRIALGTAHPAVEDRQVFVLDHNALIAAAGEKNRFELELMKLMKQAIKSGNIILVISDLSGFIASAKSVGSDAVSILDPYLASSTLQVVALSDSASFHQNIEANAALAERFEKIMVEGSTFDETMRLLEDKVARFEAQYGVFFTYQALAAVADSAERYFPGSSVTGKAIDLLVEIIPVMQEKGLSFIAKQDVLNFVEQKTGIPVAGIKPEEREKLSRLEAILHERIIGQELAVDAIANALRRSRSGVSNPNRPMGSFLFIGPTGVGKTETTKALAAVFFDDESRIERLDMSEYSAPDALVRLIGSFETGKPGTLVTMLREKQYGVLLLDEFEKANAEVHNLFLQILDEGVFSDMMGKKVNARNLIIIATSNAGSDRIWELSKQGKDIANAKDEIIDGIVKDRIFKPELLNRFDGVILFHPLNDIHLEGIARKMLSGLKARLEDRRINLKITDELVNFLVRQGSDPKFGARPLNRAIQDTIEGAIAEKLIGGEVRPGAEIELTQKDLV